MHTLLARQLRKLGLDAGSPPTPEGWRALLERVSRAYAEADQERYMLERSLEISSAEMQELYDDLRRVAEAELEHLGLAMAVQESVAEGVMVVGAAREVLLCNGRFRELWRLEDVPAGRDAREVLDACIPRVVDEAAFRAFVEALLDGTPTGPRADVELRDGRVLERYAAPVRGSEGTALGRVISVRDVTDERRLAAQRAMVTDRMASVGQLVASVAHEINNPLAYISGNLEVVTTDLETRAAEDDKMLLEALQDARLGVERIRVIVRDLRLLSRVEAGEPRTSVDVNTVLQSALQMAHNELRHRATVVCDIGKLPRVVANESRLCQVFLNLLVNAAQAIPGGRASAHEVRIVSRTGPAGEAVVEIHDTGCGIASHLRDRIFDPFFTTKPVGTGTGLGLSICKGIVEKLGGKVHVESVPGSGSTFTVELPPGPGASDAAPAAAKGAVRFGRRRVLVVDDDAQVQRWLSRALSRGHDVVAVSTVDEALARVAEADYDVILCDVMMPDRTGQDMHVELERRRPELVARVVYMSGGAFTPSLQAFLETVPNERLEKPVTERAVREVIERVASR